MAGWNIRMPDAEYFDHTTPGLQALVNEAMAQDELALDTETTGLVVYQDIVLYWSLSWPGRRITLNVSALPFFKDVFADRTKTWIFANSKFDLHMLANMGVSIAGRVPDTCVMHALLYEDMPHGLKFMAQHILGWKWTDFQDTFGKISKRDGVTPRDVIERAEQNNFNLLVEYAANDAYGTFELYQSLKKQLQESNTYSLFADVHPWNIRTLWDLFSKVEVPYTKVLYKNERNGIKVNRARLEEIEPKVISQMAQLDKDIAKEAGWLVNVKSNADLEKLFFEQMKLPVTKMTKGGKSGVRKPSTDKDVRAKFEDDHLVIRLINKRMKLGTFYSGFLVKMQKLTDQFDRIHTRFNQDVTRTGRLSSSTPNMQNVPTLENDVWQLRKAFIPEEGNVILAGDYEQLEMRLVAAGSMSKDMIDVFLRGWDIHMGNASLMFNIPYEEIKQARAISSKVKEGELSADYMTDRVLECLQARAAAKNIGFGMNYGMGAKKLANDIGITVAEAKMKIEQYKKTYPAVTDFYAEAIAECEQSGFAFTVLGRKRSVPEITSRRSNIRSRAERIAVNTPIQGSAADVCKMAQILCDKANLEERFGVYQLLQVHDEIVFEGPKETAQEAKEEIRDWMEHSLPHDLALPLTTSIGIGPSWGQAH